MCLPREIGRSDHDHDENGFPENFSQVPVGMNEGTDVDVPTGSPAN